MFVTRNIFHVLLENTCFFISSILFLLIHFFNHFFDLCSDLFVFQVLLGRLSLYFGHLLICIFEAPQRLLTCQQGELRSDNNLQALLGRHGHIDVVIFEPAILSPTINLDEFGSGIQLLNLIFFLVGDFDLLGNEDVYVVHAQSIAQVQFAGILMLSTGDLERFAFGIGKNYFFLLEWMYPDGLFIHQLFRILDRFGKIRFCRRQHRR